MNWEEEFNTEFKVTQKREERYIASADDILEEVSDELTVKKVKDFISKIVAIQAHQTTKTVLERITLETPEPEDFTLDRVTELEKGIVYGYEEAEKDLKTLKQQILEEIDGE